MAALPLEVYKEGSHEAWSNLREWKVSLTMAGVLKLDFSDLFWPKTFSDSMKVAEHAGDTLSPLPGVVQAQGSLRFAGSFVNRTEQRPH